jgi:thioredoxin-like negative regulator of GroEL
MHAQQAITGNGGASQTAEAARVQSNQRVAVGRSAESETPAAANDQPSLVFFYSPTSGLSRRAEGFLAQVLQRRRNHATFRLVPIDADRRPDLLERLQVRELPTLLVVADGRVRARLAKPSGCDAIAKLLSPWLK